MGGLDIWQYSSLRTEFLKSYSVYLKNPMMVPKSTIYKQKRKVFAFSSILPCFPPFPLTSSKIIPKCLKNSAMKYKEDTRRSNSSKPIWKKQQKHTILNILLKRQESGRGQDKRES